MKKDLIKQESGISLMILVITVIIMLILTFTVTVNISQFKEQNSMSKFTSDMTKLNEIVTQYYAKNKEIPIRNKMVYNSENPAPFASVRNPNDSTEYYVIDLDKIEQSLKTTLNLNYGKSYNTIKRMPESSQIPGNILNVYVINKQTGSIYYPKGIQAGGRTYYRLAENYKSIAGHTDIPINPQINISTMENLEDYLFGIKSVIEIGNVELDDINISECKYVYTESNTDITDASLYTGGNLDGLTTTIEKAMPAGTWYLHVLVVDKKGNNTTITSTESVTIAQTAEYPYEADENRRENRKASLLPGTYKLECWGAQGGDATTPSAHINKAGYTSGKLTLTESKTLYVYVGEKGDTTRKVKFNGGGIGGYSNSSEGYDYRDPKYYINGNTGGGATDFRISSGLWNDFSSLKSRIMVAAGSGGAAGSGASLGSEVTYDQAGGKSVAGGIQGYSGGYASAHTYVGQEGGGATQTAGGRAGVNHFNATGTNNPGTFGIGGSSISSSSQMGSGGGGGGYYGGGAGGSTLSSGCGQGGGGGSSFISGHAGCNAISETSTSSSIVHTGQANHYSGLVFTETKMIDGSGYSWTNVKGSLEQMPNPSGGFYATQTGHSGNGYARITNLN